MRPKNVFLMTIFFTLLMYSFSFAVQMPADTLTQPDTTTVRSDTTEQPDNSLNESISEDFANRLKSQLNLTDEQTDQVRSILAGYIDNHSSDDSDTGNASDQIEKILNDTQRAGWNSIRDSFWSDLKRRIRDDLD